MNLKSLDKKMKSLTHQVQTDKKFSETPAAQIGNHFKQKRRQDGYVMNRKQWEKTMHWAERVLVDEDYSHVPIEDWIACIDWCFTVAKSEQFWAQVKFTTFYTCISAYNDFNQWRKAQKKTKRVGYGKR